MSALVKTEHNLTLAHTRPDSTDIADELLLKMLFEYHEKRLTSINPKPNTNV